MFILTFYHQQESITYTLYKLYNKKFISQLRGLIQLTAVNQLSWQVFNGQNKLTKHIILDNQNMQNGFNYENIFKHSFFHEMNPEIVVHKISIGGSEFTSICRLNQITIEKLTKYIQFAPRLQTAELSLATSSQIVFNNAKHYACFNDEFHHTIEETPNLFLGEQPAKLTKITRQGTNGLIFSRITDKIPDLADKKIGKGKWIIVFIDNYQTTLCAIKNNKSRNCTSSEIYHELPSFQHSELIDLDYLKIVAQINQMDIATIIDEFARNNLNQQTAYKFNNLLEVLESNDESANRIINKFAEQISQAICKQGTLLHGINGIIFTGEIGQKQAKLRQMICNHLAWVGINISNKSNLENQTIISKKDSQIQIFTLPAEPEQAMLKQLSERL